MNVQSIGSYSYSTPKMAFKGNEAQLPANVEQGTEKKITKKQVGIAAGIATAAAAVATTIVAFKRGKTINGDSAKLLQNLKTGFKSIFTKVGKYQYKSAKGALNASKYQDTLYKTRKGQLTALEMQHTINEFGPEGSRHAAKEASNYVADTTKLFMENVDENGVVKNVMKREDVLKLMEEAAKK